jgi:ATP-dependent protease ClpP protease subunit
MSEQDSDRIVPLFGKINYETMTKTMELMLGHWKKDRNKEIKLIVCSYGGMCDPSFMFIDMIKFYKINLTTIASDGVGSMAVPIFASGIRRFVSKHTDFFLHDLGFSPDSYERLSVSELQRKSDNLGVSQRWYADYLEERTSGKFKASEVLKRMKAEVYLYPEDIIKLGLAHEMI